MMNLESYKSRTLVDFENITMTGDGMLPTIGDGDLVLIDKASQEIVDKGVYAIEYAKKELICRLVQDGHKIILASDDGSLNISVDQHDINVKGRAILINSTRGL
ncbi:MAG: hypothetical protein COB23_07195 [Methylophaga sp.]|nr:MAG: hypothetical protein COB23_07195 [Methylophaga sp.]